MDTREATSNLVIASFQHGTSRAQDPQLHTHNVILNATKGEDGVWRSLEPRAIYQLQKQIGAIYRQELALKVRELGYDIDVGKDSMFEIRGVSAEAMAAFSTRSAEIEAALGERGTTRDEASAAEKQAAAQIQHQEIGDGLCDWHRDAPVMGAAIPVLRPHASPRV